MTQYIYKICSSEEWETSQKLGVFQGSEIDLLDGFIHFSPLNLLESTVEKHFPKRMGVILEIDASDMEDIVWEEARGGQLFPHLYRPFDTRVVSKVYDLRADLQSLMRSRNGNNVE